MNQDQLSAKYAYTYKEQINTYTVEDCAAWEGVCNLGPFTTVLIKTYLCCGHLIFSVGSPSPMTTRYGTLLKTHVGTLCTAKQMDVNAIRYAC